MIWDYFTKKPITKTAEEKLKKIKAITDNGKPRKEILEKVYVICLEELPTVNKDISNNIPEPEKIQLGEKELKNGKSL